MHASSTRAASECAGLVTLDNAPIGETDSLTWRRLSSMAKCVYTSVMWPRDGRLAIFQAVHTTGLVDALRAPPPDMALLGDPVHIHEEGLEGLPCDRGVVVVHESDQDARPRELVGLEGDIQ